MTATTNPPNPAQDPAEDLGVWLRGLGFAQLDGGWFHRENVRIRLVNGGEGVNLHISANGRPAWLARLQDAPKTAIIALLGIAGIETRR